MQACSPEDTWFDVPFPRNTSSHCQNPAVHADAAMSSRRGRRTRGLLTSLAAMLLQLR